MNESIFKKYMDDETKKGSNDGWVFHFMKDASRWSNFIKIQHLLLSTSCVELILKRYLDISHLIILIFMTPRNLFTPHAFHVFTLDAWESDI